jgi:hypothetical protein
MERNGIPGTPRSLEADLGAGNNMMTNRGSPGSIVLVVPAASCSVLQCGPNSPDCAA